MNTPRIFIVSSFTDTPFRGNPAGVCILQREHSGAEMQAIATELRQPETAFVWPEGDDWQIRWFSPQVEVDLCGHATLAAAKVLWAEQISTESISLVFRACRATLAARVLPEGWIELDFPVIRGVLEPADTALLACVDLAPVRTARCDTRWIFEYETAEQVRALRPRFDALRATGVRSLIVTAASDMDGFDIVSRNFAPIVGVNEDQVTGAAHACLAPYWENRLGGDLRCWQASERGGELKCRLLGDWVRLRGRARIELAGDWVAGAGDFD